MTTNLPFQNWAEVLGNEHLTKSARAGECDVDQVSVGCHLAMVLLPRLFANCATTNAGLSISETQQSVLPLATPTATMW